MGRCEIVVFDFDRTNFKLFAFRNERTRIISAFVEYECCRMGFNFLMYFRP